MFLVIVSNFNKRSKILNVEKIKKTAQTWQEQKNVKNVYYILERTVE